MALYCSAISRCVIPISLILFRYYNTFDAYHIKHDLSAMERLFSGYINAQLDTYLKILQE